MNKSKTILAIESSCDESAVALAKVSSTHGFSLIDHKISSQIEVHQLYGGVVPEIASREHLKNIPIIIEQLCEDAQLGLTDVDLIAVTRGPGLKGCLLIGLGVAQGIAAAINKPVYGINHIEGHVLAPLMENSELKFPFLELIVSGGHTELLVVRAVGEYQILARTMDDAAGEAFDKSAHLLGFPYPGGAALAQLADSAVNKSYKLPKVMREHQDFSFSGLKTAIYQLVRKHQTVLNSDSSQRAEFCAAIQDAIIDTLLHKVRLAIEKTGIRQIAVSGGVAANKSLRARIKDLKGAESFFPSPIFCTDNAAMIAFVASQRLLNNKLEQASIEVLSRWPVEEIV